jgi:hypothetical protein
MGVPDSCVALMGSFAEAAATVATCLPPGRVVVGAEEYRSNLFPWLALDGGAHQLQSSGIRAAALGDRLRGWLSLLQQRQRRRGDPGRAARVSAAAAS